MAIHTSMRFSLRLLFIVLFLLAIPLSVLANLWHQWRMVQRDEEVYQLIYAKCKVTAGYHEARGLIQAVRGPHYQGIRSIWYDIQPECKEYVGLHLEEFSNLERVRIHRMGISGAHLKFLEKLPALKELAVQDEPAITDSALRRIAHLRHLELLSLWGTSIADGALPDIATLSQLKCLELYRTKITGTGFIHLSKLRRLKRLGIAGAPICPEGFEALTQLEQLDYVQLSADQVDTAIPWLKKMPNLKQVTVSGSTDELTVERRVHLQKQLAIIQCDVYNIPSNGE